MTIPKAICRLLFLCGCCFFTGITLAAGPGDNLPDSVRLVPRLGVKLPPDKVATLRLELFKLEELIKSLVKRNDQLTNEHLADVEIFYRAAHDALKHQEFFKIKEADDALELLTEGQRRANDLLNGKAPWAFDTGLVVRGYTSRIDGSAQPYGLVIPANYKATGSASRLDLWFHGRGETLSEVNFLTQRRKTIGKFAPANTIVLHPYGRYSNAFKFAGEVDVLEALADAQRRYNIDPDRISARGFSMGGAACWQFAVHYSDRWFAANPGAGFAETPEFLKFFQKETLNPTWYEKKLWHLYDCTDYSRNLSQCPTVAYSGELDIQKQAADIMATSLKQHGIDLVHIIGPETKHKYHPDAAKEVDRRLASLAKVGRQRNPKQVHLVTYTLKYNRMNWVTIDAMTQHWERASVDATIAGDSRVSLQTTGVEALTLNMKPGYCPLSIDKDVQLQIDKQAFKAPRPKSDRSWSVQLHREDGKWKLGPMATEGLAKRHDLQGPIDDALMDSFIFVRPTGESPNAEVSQWVESELARAEVHWRRHFRGDARVKDDAQITEHDIASANLVLWGDPSSNQIIQKIIDQLPLQWDAKQLVMGKAHYPADKHAAIMVYPNPLNPKRYIVLNSSFTYRDYAYLNNARQVPMLPDWAIIDLTTPPGTQWPGKVVNANFFDEAWGVK